jgi:membrane protein
VDSLLNFIRHKLWPPTEPRNPLLRWLLVPARYAYALGRDFISGELSLRAMSLVYTTMLAIVPALAFAFAIAKGLGMHNQFEPAIEDLLAPLGPEAAEIANNVTGFVDNVNGLVLGGLSIGVLLLTAISMAQKVESSFNYVWRVDRPRSFGRRFSEYLSVMLMGPLVMAIAFGAITSLSSTTIVEWLRGQSELFAVMVDYLGSLVPVMMIVAAFVFLYMFIPNARVKFLPALIGGAIGGVVWATSAFVFANFTTSSSRYQMIYSSFATIFLLLFWIYISWLLGSQLAYYVQHPYQLRRGQRTGPLDNGTRERLCLSVMYLIGNDFVSPSHGWTHESLAAMLRVPRSALDPVMAALTDSGLIARTSEERLIPGRDPHRIALTDIMEAIRGGGRVDREPQDKWSETVDEIWAGIDQAIEAELGSMTLGQLVDEHADDLKDDN